MADTNIRHRDGAVELIAGLVCRSIGGCILGLLLLPHFHIGTLALPPAIADVYRSGVPFTALLVASVCAVLIWITYIGSTTVGRYNAIMWLLTGCLLGYVIFGMLGRMFDYAVHMHFLLLLSAYCAGLLSARLIENANRFTAVVACFATVQAAYVLYSVHSLGYSAQTTTSGLYVLMLFGLPCALVRTIRANHPLVISIWLFSASVNVGAIILTCDRGALISATVGVAWILWRLIENRRSAMCAGVLVTLALPVLLFVHLPQIVPEKPNSGQVAAVKLLAKPSVQSQYALVGMGAGYLMNSVSFSDAVPGKRTVLEYAEPSSMFVSWFDEAGIAGVVMILGLMAVGLWIALMQRSDSAACIGSIWISLLVAGLFAAPFGAVAQSCGNVLFGSLVGVTMLLQAGAPVPRSAGQECVSELTTRAAV